MDRDKNTPERAVLVGLDCPILGEDSSDYESMEELAELLETAGGECTASILQSRSAPDPALFIGGGKTAEVELTATNTGAELIIFDNELSPSQLRNLSKATGKTVLDRPALILDIFADRAHTSEGRLQVELAQYRYMLSKLSGLGSAMSRLGGGIGTRGPGESKLESDRRHIRRRIEHLEEEFERVRRVRSTQRSRRMKSGIPTVAIVGYTNAGKSTLLGALCGDGIVGRDRLFDTLDPTARLYKANDGFSAIFSDTVGFIRKLPHALIEAFKATLEELKYADAILHVIDYSSDEWERHAEVTEKLIAELGVAGTPRIRVFNKMDRCSEPAPLRENDVAISASMGIGLGELIASLRRVLELPRRPVELRFAYSQIGLIEMVRADGLVYGVDYQPDAVVVKAECDERLIERLRAEKVEIDG